MRIRSSLNRFVARILVAVLLVAQTTVAAYACPAMLGEVADEVSAVTVLTAGEASASDDPGMRSVGGLDGDLPNLCLSHCQRDRQNADSTPAPTWPAALPASLSPLPGLQHSAGGLPPASFRNARAPAEPPHAILHCCLRH